MKRAFRSLWFQGAALVVWIAWSFQVHGDMGFAGMMLGLFATTVSMLGLWLGIRWVGQAMSDKPMLQPWEQVFGPVFILAKLPIIFAGWMLAVRLGADASTCFLWGLGWVYFVAVGWAATQP